MAASPIPFPQQRAPRVKLGGSILVMLQLGDRSQVRARLNQLSINGGVLQLSEPLAEELPIEVMFHIGSTTVRAQAHTTTPMWATQGCLQPFRFTNFHPEVRQQLATDLQSIYGASPAIPTQAEPAHALAQPTEVLEATVEDDKPVTRNEVTLYFEQPEDALRFTVALSSVIFNDQSARSREDTSKLAREIAKISRVTTRGVLKPASSTKSLIQ
jgi:hypothetical protein